MKAETISASAASCRSTSQRYRSAKRSVTANPIVSPKVTAIRKKKGSTGNDPGAVICATTAPPSRSVLITARTLISHASRRRRSVSTIPDPRSLIPGPRSLIPDPH